MSFLHLSLLAGGAFVAVPIILHLLMRRRPKHAIFPALRFLKQLQQTNQQKLRFKNWLLLLLRCAVVLGLALALARPTVASEHVAGWGLLGGLGFLSMIAGLAAISGFRGGLSRWSVGGLAILSATLAIAAIVPFLRMQGSDSGTLLAQREAPVAAALVFDTSPRMGLQSGNTTRLKEAKEMGDWLLRQLPEDSEVAIVDNGLGTAVFSIDIMAAQKAIQALSLNTLPQPLTQPLKAALDLLAANDKSTKEIYLITDLTRQSWSGSPTGELAERLATAAVRVYVLDVGVEEPQNVAVGMPRLSGELLARGSQLSIECELRNIGRRREVTAELAIEKPDPRLPIIVDGEPVLPELQLRNEQTVELEDDGIARIEFSLPALSAGSHHGQIRLRGSDGLEIDDQRYFTVQATEHWPVLVTAGAGADPEPLADVLSPLEEAQTGQAPFECDIRPIDDLKSAKLTAYSAVALLDPPPLAEGVWRRLAQFVDRGGGLAIFLGRNARSAEAFNSPAALELLPSRIVRQWSTSGRGLTMRMSSAPHPMLTGLRSVADSIPWEDFSIKRHWAMETLDDTNVIYWFSNRKPAIVERSLGLGRVVVMNTPISDPLHVNGRPAWNRLPTGLDPWPFFALVDDLFRYIVQQGESRLNYEVGQPVSLTVRDDTGRGRYQLFDPTGVWQEVTAAKNRVSVPFAVVPGTYRLRPASGRGVNWGFSMNLPTQVTDLERLDRMALDQWLGEGRYRLARDRDAVDREVGEARIGHELYPWLLIFVALVLWLEHLLANRFYTYHAVDESPRPREAAAA